MNDLSKEAFDDLVAQDLLKELKSGKIVVLSARFKTWKIVVSLRGNLYHFQYSEPWKVGSHTKSLPQVEAIYELRELLGLRWTAKVVDAFTVRLFHKEADEFFTSELLIRLPQRWALAAVRRHPGDSVVVRVRDGVEVMRQYSPTLAEEWSRYRNRELMDAEWLTMLTHLEEALLPVIGDKASEEAWQTIAEFRAGGQVKQTFCWKYPDGAHFERTLRR